MKIFETLSEWQIFRANLTAPVGFVPTMGNLHEGHLALVKQSQMDNAHTAVSIFVNPTQFNQQEDFKYYPRTVDADLKALNAAGVDYCLLPQEADLYPDGYRFQVQEIKESLDLEGASRKGHFTGVLTVVMKLLNVIKPARAYFGEKDYQQYTLIRDMVNAFFMDITIIPCPTIRHASQLALSSRNHRLTPDERVKADEFARIFHQPNESIDEISSQLNQASIEVDYIKEHDNRRYIAVFIGAIRLIDNYDIINKALS